MINFIGEPQYEGQRYVSHLDMVGEVYTYEVEFDFPQLTLDILMPLLVKAIRNQEYETAETIKQELKTRGWVTEIEGNKLRGRKIK